MISELESLTGLGSELVRRARAAGVLLVWRAQVRQVAKVVVRHGRAEDSSAASVSGHGVQVFTEEGRTALGSRDGFREEPSLKLLDRVLGIVHGGSALDLARNPAPDLPVVRARAVPEGLEAYSRIDLAAVARRLAELETELAARVPGVELRAAFQSDLDAWRILRSDGTDVLYAMPRCTLSLSATTGGDGARHSIVASIAGPSPGLPWDEEKTAPLLRRAAQGARLATDLPDAPPHPAGSIPIVLDYALAKGLAHEAFGHASEADGYRSSVLARDGRFRRGEVVGASHVSIIDEPIEGDHAWQPFSPNGVPRRRVAIVERGRLAEGLSDPWSAGPGGIPLTGAERAETFRNAPLPRMSNIRIEADASLPTSGAFEDYGPSEVRDLLLREGVLQRYPRIAYLSGYSGGQVNTATGDFVFQCKAIYALDRDGWTLHKPAVFSGSMFGALRAVREAFGPLRLDAIGRCGKGGQGVPSSGGSHWFLVLDAEPSVRLGGR